jgi:hypothetical protein
MYVLYIVVCPCVLSFLVIVLSVLLRYTDSDYLPLVFQALSFVLKIKMSIVYIFKFLFYSNCTRSWVRAVVGSNQRLYIWHLFLLSTHHLRKNAKTGWLGIRIIYASGATCLPADCCFSEPAL